MRSDYVDRIMLLAQMNTDYLNVDAIFSDETENYRTPAVPKKNERIKIKLRTAKDNVDRVYMYYGESFIRMHKTDSDTLFDYYTAGILCSGDVIEYYFTIVKNGREYIYNEQGLVEKANNEYNFVIIPDFETPEWAKGAVMYQIYVDRFYNGDKSNDVVNDEYTYLGNRAKKIDDWNSPLEQMDVCNFYGGDLQGVIDKLDYLQDLGVDVIYFNPVFVSPSNHKYDIQDYDYIDPHYGVIVNDGGDVLSDKDNDNANATMYMKRTIDKENLDASNALMIRLIELAHSRGMRVILDGVFNHCGAFNKWLDKEGFYGKCGYPKGAFGNEDSVYRDFFRWKDNGGYDCWWGHDNHPKLNFEDSKLLTNYILEIGKKWVSPPFNADGWRLDVAADLGYGKEYNMTFWREFRKAIKEANPEAIILAEHYGDPKDWLQGDQWDTVMNYDAFMEPITWFLTGMEKHSESADESLYNNAIHFEGVMRYFSARLSGQSLMVAMNELSNHDHSRFLTRTNRKVGRLNTMGAEAADTGVNKAVMREAITLQMTWIGAPTIYYGDEVGMTGWTDPDNRRPFPWGNEDIEIYNYYKDMIKIHKDNRVFVTGSLDYLYMDYGVICVGRWNDKEKAVILLNNNNTIKKVSVPIWRLGVVNGEIMTRVIKSDMTGYTKETLECRVKSGVFEVELEPCSSYVYIRR